MGREIHKGRYHRGGRGLKSDIRHIKSERRDLTLALNREGGDNWFQMVMRYLRRHQNWRVVMTKQRNVQTSKQSEGANY